MVATTNFRLSLGIGVTRAPARPEDARVWRHSRPGRPDRKLPAARAPLRRAPSPWTWMIVSLAAGPSRSLVSVRLASLGDGPAVRRDAPPKSNKGEEAGVCRPSQPTPDERLSSAPSPARFPVAERGSTRQSTARHSGTAPVTTK